MTVPDIKELVKRLQRIQVGMANEEEDAVLAAIAALEALASEVAEARLHEDCANGVASKIASGYQRLLIRAEAAEAERDRLAGEVERLRARDEVWSELDKVNSAERDRLKAEVAKLEKDMEEATDPRNWKSS